MTVLFNLNTDASDHHLGAVIMQVKIKTAYSLLFAKAKHSSKAVIQPLRESFYQLLKPARNARISC
jgi:hypothetical protein